MKKLTLILAAVLMATGLSFAQINVGGRAALNFGTLYGDDADDAPWGLGFAAGVSAKIGLASNMSIVPDVDINLRRNADDEATWSVWALEIPVMFRFNATPELFLEAGPMISFLLSGELSYEDDNVEAAAEEFGTPDYGDYLNTFEFGLAFGAGYAVMPNLDINARFNLGLTSEIEEIDMGMFGKMEIIQKNMQIQVGATYWFM